MVCLLILCNVPLKMALIFLEVSVLSQSLGTKVPIHIHDILVVVCYVQTVSPWQDSLLQHENQLS